MLKPGEQHVQRIIPNGFIELIFYLDKHPEYIRNNSSFKSGSIINGQQKGFYDIIVREKLNLVSIVFKPQGAKLFLNLPVSEIYDQSIPAALIFKNEINELQSKMQEAIGEHQRIKLIEIFLIDQLKKKKEYEYQRISDSVNYINSSKGSITIEKLSDRACLSKKQFERSFTSFVGITPKKFLRTIRFQYTVYNQQIRNFKNLTELAFESGYYDQSHMINDFKELSGLTPKQYFDDCEVFSDYFSS